MTREMRANPTLITEVYQPPESSGIAAKQPIAQKRKSPLRPRSVMNKPASWLPSAMLSLNASGCIFILILIVKGVFDSQFKQTLLQWTSWGVVLLLLAIFMTIILKDSKKIR